MKVVIRSKDVHEETIKSGKSEGQVIRSQWAFFEHQGIEKPFKVSPPKAGAYEPGEYEIDSSSFSISRYDKLELNYVNLVKVAAEPAQLRKAG